MIQFTLSLAGVPMGVSALFPSTKQFCEAYLSEETPAFSVSLSQGDIDAERERAVRQDALTGGPRHTFSDPYLETLALFRAISGPLLDYGALIFHGSVVAVDGRAYLFTAPSGTGKTTHSRFWLEKVPGAHILNGDKPLVRVTPEGVLACGTPWQGKERYGCNEILPLKAICLLERAEENVIRPMPFSEAISFLVQQIHRPQEPERFLKTLEWIGEMSRVSLYRMGCNLDPEAALVSYRAMGS